MLSALMPFVAPAIPTFPDSTQPLPSQSSATGWMCPRCGSTHAPHVMSCQQCDASKYPRVPLYLIGVLQEKVDAVRASHPEIDANGVAPEVTLYAHDLQRLLDAVKPR